MMRLLQMVQMDTVIDLWGILIKVLNISENIYIDFDRFQHSINTVLSIEHAICMAEDFWNFIDITEDGKISKEILFSFLTTLNDCRYDKINVIWYK